MGLIPAHAGKTRQDRASYAGSWAHPRSRGENSVMRSFLPVGMGSSPLTRGKLELGPQPDDVPGLIPAHAGKTRAGYSLRHTSRAHPRSRGENSQSGSSLSASAGSSPLTRGKPGIDVRTGMEVRLIPAHAGKTTQDTSRSRWRRAHPRSRGENIGGHFLVVLIEGSSPLTRGKPCLSGEF